MLAVRQVPAQLPALRSLARTINELPLGSQSQVAVEEGNVAAFLSFAQYNRAIGTATYMMRVLNNSPKTLQARLSSVDTAGMRRALFTRPIGIAPFSLKDECFDVRVERDFALTLLEVTDGATYITVEAPAPPPQPKRWPKWVAAGTAGATLAAGALFASVPRVDAFAAPQRVLAGTALEVPYATRGFGTVQYQLANAQGAQLAAGLVPAGAGVLRLRVPADSHGSPYRVRLSMRGALGSDQQDASVVALGGASIPAAAPKKKTASPAPVAAISELAVTPNPVKAGGTIDVRYAANAVSGTIWLLDNDGRAWAATPYDPSGHSSVVIPLSAAGRQLRVVVSAKRGATHAQSTVGLLVLPSGETADTATAETPGQTASIHPQLRLSASSVSSGQTIVARLTGVTGDVRVTMTNAAGKIVEQGDGTAEAGVAIGAPAVGSATTYSIVATFSDGMSEQSLVRSVVVHP